MNATSRTGALLLCRAEPRAVRPVARLLREPMLLTPAGDGWSVLVPEGRPWRDGGTDGPRGTDAEPVDQVAASWAAALAVGSSWPVLAVWWDGERAGYSLSSGFRRAVGYVWLADGTPVGEDETMRALADRLGLDPVLDVQALDGLTRPDPYADARNRLLGLLAVLGRIGLILPPGLEPGAPADRLRAAVGNLPGTEPVVWDGQGETVRPGLGRAGIVRVGYGRLGLWAYGPGARVLGGAQVAAGLPLALWGAGRRRGGWVFAGALLMAHGALGLAYGRCDGTSAGPVTGAGPVPGTGPVHGTGEPAGGAGS